ncbi:MAG: MBL fold metallo-hydrolase [Candidatus Pacebacteria bacterium]|nr:MBL fold metallo-hydrolase [Candidatus Paceibacterota bacterium]
MSNDISISRFCFFVFSFTVGIGMLGYVGWNFFQPKPMIVSFLDVGQGDAIFIETPSGNQILVDGGPGRNVLSELGAFMHFSDRHIDMIIATHADADHITGLIPVIEQYSVGTFVDNGMRADTNIDQALVDLVQEKNIPYIVARRGMRFILDAKRGIFLETLLPESVERGGDRNSASLVFRLVYGENEILLTGDVELENEQILVSETGTLDSDILKVGHHGSGTSTGLEFVKRVDPQFAVLSYGCDNRYGHPHPTVTKNLASEDVIILSTCEMGTVTMYGNGKDVWLGK